ncbi:MAG: ParB N-terminal domain-containing protein [Erysipelotrichaceae bacterium]|nr:ParB N-terminal domain-containing protein [Erysipelotrichaceae bacterium]MDY6035448.1 ParB N-terminal domain-containing protein [Bulleidia sp.]
MINKKVHISKIHYITIEDKELLDSIAKRGVAIAVQVNALEDGYECIDGNKRLTACAILAQQNDKYAMVPVMILNDYSKAGSAFWGNTQNKH